MAGLAVGGMLRPAPAQTLLVCGQPVVRTLAGGAEDTYRLPNVDAQVLIDAADTSDKPGRLDLEASSGEETQTGSLSLRPQGPTTVTVSDVGGSAVTPYAVVANVVSDSPSNCGIPLPCGLTPEVHQLAVPGAVDAYTFDGKAGDRVTIRAGVGGTGIGIKVQLRAFDSVGQPVANTYSGLLSLTLARAGTHTVLISGFDVPLKAGTYGIAMVGPGCPAGPDITFFGLASASGRPLVPGSYDDEGRPVYELRSRSPFLFVLEARPGLNGAPVGAEAYRYDPNDPDVVPDLQVLLTRPLGDGNPAVCDTTTSPPGGVPAVPALDFAPTARVADAMNDFGCRVDDGTGQSLGRTDPEYSCTESLTGIGFVNSTSKIQFCEFIYQAWQFSRGSTVLRARVADVHGVVGPAREIVVRVAGDDEAYLVKDIVAGSASSNPNTLLATQSGLYFVADTPTTGLELWRSDGTRAGTRLVSDLRPGSLGSIPTNLTLFDDRILFSANDGMHGSELWAVAVASGTVSPVLDINHGQPSSTPLWLTRIGSRVAFSANDGEHGSELWVTDGTGPGTQLVYDLNQNPSSAGSSPGRLVAGAGGVMFSADDGTKGRELWISDLTEAGTRRVRDIRPGQEGSRPTELTRVGELVFFVANDGQHGIELWRSDGTEEGTRLVKDIRSGDRDSTPAYLVDVGGTLFFTADDGVHGPELWRSDGTANGTVLVRDIQPGVVGSTPTSLTSVRGQVFFSAEDGVHGRELWRSDGTPAGTMLVRDIVPGDGGSNPYGLTNVNGILVFAAADPSYGVEPWSSDGSEGGTVRLAEIASGSAGSNPTSFTPAQGFVFCAAADGLVGRELWALAPPSNQSCAGDCENDWEVTPSDLAEGVSIALNESQLRSCPNMDSTDTGMVTVDDIVRAANASTGECAPQ